MCSGIFVPLKSLWKQLCSKEIEVFNKALQPIVIQRTRLRTYDLMWLSVTPISVAHVTHVGPTTPSSPIHVFSHYSLNNLPSILLALQGKHYSCITAPWNTILLTMLPIDHWCQHPRWNLHYQGAPVSVYMWFDPQNTILYIISYKEDDTVIRALKSILDLTSTAASQCKKK
jgi:hypothetical protein